MFWQEHINNWEKSGKSQSEYCRLNNLNINNFSKRKIKINSNTTPDKNDFIRYEVSEVSKKSEIEVVIKDIYKIKLVSGFDDNLFKKILKSIGELQ